MANNNVQSVRFLRNGSLYSTREEAKTALTTKKASFTAEQDGSIILARYQEVGDPIKTLVGFIYFKNNVSEITIFDIDDAGADVDQKINELRTEIEKQLGTGITSANTVTAQLAALSGNGQSTSAETSVEGAKRYADELKNQMDYAGVTTGTGVYVTNVTQSDGIVSATTATLPTVTDAKEAKKVVVSVSEDKGTISVERGTISSTSETIVLTDNADGGVNFEVNIDNDTIVQDETSKKLKVASAALTQYVGDEDTIHISAADANNNKTVSSYLTIQKVTTGLSEEVKEEYHLIGHSGTTIGDPVKIYKDSHIVSIEYQDNPELEHYQNLIYTYIDASGETQTAYVDISELVLEAEFASGTTVVNHVVRGVVDPTSETFLTVGANGFKLAGVQDAIDAAVDGLDATVSNSGNSGHVGVEIVEENGKLISVTVTEDDIASADDIEELSAKTVTALTSTNGSITADIDDAVGCKTYDIQTDADKIKMSGFSADATSALSGIAESDSIATAFEKTNAVITEDERVTAEALTDLDTRVDTISGDVDTIKEQYISGVSVNGNAVTVANHVAPISITAATSAATGTTAIVVDTDNSGNITLGIANIDCGYYA